MGEQIRRHVDDVRELGRGGVADTERVDDAQSSGVAERRVDARPVVDG